MTKRCTLLSPRIGNGRGEAGQYLSRGTHVKGQWLGQAAEVATGEAAWLPIPSSHSP
jgi:hypothetical protein